MKAIKKFLGLSLISIGLISLASCEKNNDLMSGNSYSTVISVQSDGITTFKSEVLPLVCDSSITVTESELDGLLKLKEEEKLARDVYSALFGSWGNQVFANIAHAEENHLQAVIFLIQNTGVNDTAKLLPGKFTNPDLEELYNQLVLKGSESIEAALSTGALIEEMDIYDLKQLSSETSNENILLVYENLMKGSRNHLRAFTKQLTWLGLTYLPVYLNVDEFNAIINTSMEKATNYQNKGFKGNNGHKGKRHGNHN